MGYAEVDLKTLASQLPFGNAVSSDLIHGARYADRLFASQLPALAVPVAAPAFRCLSLWERSRASVPAVSVPVPEVN